MRTKNVIVGILGGMGPEATVELMRRVVAVTPAADDEDHIRMLVEHNPKVPSRIKALIEGTGESPAPVLIDMARRLERAGASVLAMPCNTAHGYAREIAGAVEIPLLDMIALAAERISRMVLEHRRVGMLASSAVRSLGLYEKALAPFGIETVYPGDQSAVMDIIKAVKRGDTGERQRRGLVSVAEELEGKRADLLLIACTELSVLADSLDDGIAVLDALDVLVEEIVACGLATHVRVPAAGAIRPKAGRGAIKRKAASPA
jgi:aspartate racemase